MNEYDDYDVVYYCDDTPQIGGCAHRKPTRYDLDTMTPAEIEAYGRYDEYRFYGGD